MSVIIIMEGGGSEKIDASRGEGHKIFNICEGEGPKNFDTQKFQSAGPPGHLINEHSLTRHKS